MNLAVTNTTASTVLGIAVFWIIIPALVTGFLIFCWLAERQHAGESDAVAQARWRALRRIRKQAAARWQPARGSWLLTTRRYR